MGRWPLKMTRSKQESTATIKLVNLATKRDSVFMASSSGWGPQQTPFWREDAVLAHPFWLRLRRVRICHLEARRPRLDDLHMVHRARFNTKHVRSAEHPNDL